jgi:RNA polymerase sigma factor (sigma-70 family)
MDERPIRSLLQGLGSPRPQETWERFLREYSGTILQVIHFSEPNPDHVSDCFVFVCEQLSQNRFRRLRRFQPEGPAKFSTWLRVVVRHLYLDWRRKQFGRHRVFKSIAALSGFDQAVFRLVYEQGTSPEESLLHLAPLFPGTTKERFAQSLERIRLVLTPRQIWLLSSRSVATTPAETGRDHVQISLVEQIPDPLPDPATLAARQEELRLLSKALARLAGRDRLLIRLRFEQELTLEQVARLMKFRDAQTADRRIRQVLEQLRQEMTR